MWAGVGGEAACDRPLNNSGCTQWSRVRSSIWPRPVAIVPIGAAAEAEAWLLADRLRRAGIAVELAFRGKPAQRMKRADRARARLALSIGDDELARGTVKLRDLDSGAEEELPRAAVAARLGAREAS